MPLALLASPLFRYGIALLAVLSLLGGLYGKGRSDGRASERAAWVAAMAVQKAQADKLLADRLAENAAKEAASDALNAKLEKEAADAREETNTAHAAYNRSLDGILRKQARCPVANPAPGSAETGSPAVRAELEAPTVELNREALEALGDWAAVADNTESVMKACQAWAVSVGR